MNDQKILEQIEKSISSMQGEMDMLAKKMKAYRDIRESLITLREIISEEEKEEVLHQKTCIHYKYREETRKHVDAHRGAVFNMSDIWTQVFRAVNGTLEGSDYKLNKKEYSSVHGVIQSEYEKGHISRVCRGVYKYL